jgi:hypothetical protein
VLVVPLHVLTDIKDVVTQSDVVEFLSIACEHMQHSNHNRVTAVLEALAQVATMILLFVDSSDAQSRIPTFLFLCICPAIAGTVCACHVVLLNSQCAWAASALLSVRNRCMSVIGAVW